VSNVFDIIGHPAQWPDLQRMHQFWAIVLAVVVILVPVIYWVRRLIKHYKDPASLHQGRSTVSVSSPDMSETGVVSTEETYVSKPNSPLFGWRTSLLMVGIAVFGNVAMFLINGSQALHHRQTVAANKALTQVLGTQISKVNTSSKTFMDVLQFDIGSKQLTCTIKRSWSTKNYDDASQYTVAAATSLALTIMYKPNSSDVDNLTCPDGKAAQALAPTP
jgi:hypothetical protein